MKTEYCVIFPIDIIIEYIMSIMKTICSEEICITQK